MGNDRITVIFDGRCRMCTRRIKTLQRLDRHGRLRMVACQSIEGVERFGLSRPECERSVWTIDATGNSRSGGEAAMLILSTALEQPWVMRIGSLPGVRQLIDAGYRLVTTFRRRFPGPTPWCEQHPGQCVDEPGIPGSDAGTVA